MHSWQHHFPFYWFSSSKLPVKTWFYVSIQNNIGPKLSCRLWDDAASLIGSNHGQLTQNGAFIWICILHLKLLKLYFFVRVSDTSPAVFMLAEGVVEKRGKYSFWLYKYLTYFYLFFGVNNNVILNINKKQTSSAHLPKSEPVGAWDFSGEAALLCVPEICTLLREFWTRGGAN